MPKVGDKTRSVDIGLKGRETLYWEACASCGKERWVRRPESGSMCNPCAAKKRAINYQGELSKRWRGGRISRTDGYVLIHLYPTNPFYRMATNRNRVFAHRLVMALHLGRCLESWEVVHHKNGNKGDNRLENLELVTHQQNMAYDRQDRSLRSLTQRVQTLETTVKLLLWHIQQLRQGNPVLSSEQFDKCVETIDGAPHVGDEIVQP